MALLVKLIGAVRAIEVGVFTGYSALSVALALPANGRILACDISEEFTSIGQPFWRDANVADKIDLRIGPATDTLDQCLKNGEQGPVRLCFHRRRQTQLRRVLRTLPDIAAPGGLIAIDNTLWSGRVADAPATHDADTAALHALNVKLANDTRVEISMLPVSDRLTLARKC